MSRVTLILSHSAVILAALTAAIPVSRGGVISPGEAGFWCIVQAGPASSVKTLTSWNLPIHRCQSRDVYPTQWLRVAARIVHCELSL